MAKWYWYMAWKQTKYYRKQTAVGVLGIAVTVLALVVILSFGQGIQEFLTEQMLLLTPHLSLEAGVGDLVQENWQEAVQKVPGVLGSSPYLFFPGLIQKGSTSATVSFKAVDWDLENALFRLEDLLVEGRWSELKAAEGVVPGIELARRLGVSPGSSVQVVSTAGAQLLPVLGCFHTGYYPLDSSVVLLPLTLGQSLLGVSGISGYGLKVVDFANMDQYIQPLQRLTDLWVRPWYEKEQSMFIAMQTQKIVLIWILVFSMLVSSLGVMNVFLLRSWQQRRNVGVFRALGATPIQIGALLLAQGIYCGIAGGISGIILARLVVLLLGQVQIHLPQVFYLDSLPITWARGELWWVLLLAVGAGLLAVSWPAWRLTKIEPGEVLRGA